MDEINEKSTKRAVAYPYVSMWGGIILSLAYLSFLIYVSIADAADRQIALTSFFIGVVYWSAMYVAKKRFAEGNMGAWGIRLVNIGGLFLFVFGSFAACLNGIRIV